MRALIYARFSSDLQSPTSVGDQVRLARARCDAEGWHVVRSVSDEAISGTVPVASRPGGKVLLQLVIGSEIDVLVLEGLDRLSRDIVEQERVVRSLEFRGVRIVGLSDGYDSQAKGRTLLRGMRGLVNSVYLEDLAYKTHRGLAGQFDRGLSAGGRSYGYRTTEAEGGGRRLVIDEAEAAIVRRVFAEYADGSSVRAIVHRLNADGVPSARGGSWAVSALYGSGEKGLGLLRNELYVGRVWWNRRQWIKEPETGKRRYVERPRAEWQLREAPDLRVVPADLWDRARARERRGPPRGTREGRGAVPRTLFGGLLRCSACGGPIVAVDARRYGCNVHKDRGAAQCASADAFPREAVDRGLLTLVRDELVSTTAIAEVREIARAALQARQRAGESGAGEARRRLQSVKGEIERLVDAIATVGVSAALRERLARAEAERDQLEASVRSASPAGAGVTLEQIVAAYRRTMLRLREALERADDRDRTRALLLELLGPVGLVKDGEAMFAEVNEPAERLLLAAGGLASGIGCEGAILFGKRRRIRL